MGLRVVQITDNNGTLVVEGTINDEGVIQIPPERADSLPTNFSINVIESTDAASTPINSSNEE